MRLASMLAVALLWPCHVNAAAVFAHFMVYHSPYLCNIYNGKELTNITADER